MDSHLAYIKLPLIHRWQSVIAHEKNLKDFEFSYIPFYPSDNKVLTTYRLALADSSRCLKLFLSHDQEYLKFVDSWCNPSEKLILKDLPDFHLIYPGFFGNSLSSEFTPPAVAPIFTLNDHQDDSSNMALDPVFQSISYAVPDYLIQLTPIDYENNATRFHFSCTFKYDDNDDDLSAYVPPASISITQLMSDTGLSIAAATRLVAKLPALHAAAKAKYTLPIVTPPRQVDSFIDFDELLSVYDIPLLLCTFNASMLNDDSDDESYDSDNDSFFSFSSFDNSSFISPLSESIVFLLIAFPLFCFDIDPLVAVSTIMFSNDISKYKPFSISSFFDFSKFECCHKWKIYHFSLLPVMIFIS
ncbi:hypothetical protein RhiirA1_541078 [Rhizophagus irregularis]|uniref:Uncharacterized protein n=1 Tax=Rhizophagus irregularis TaxID=588596 RepID=A0A2N0R537_9GLOM|nr:hypothetical protein RhiirA1_541078 [Rhizophagus irregularis]CAB4477035.1 unnamed protein product [Rhizophagus irregularis]